MSGLAADSIGFTRIPTKSVFPPTLPLQLHVPSAGMQIRFEDLRKDFHGFRCRAWRRIPLDSKGFQRIGFPLVHFPYKIICHLLGCSVGPKCNPWISMDFDVGPGGGSHWAPTESNETGFPLIHFLTKFMRHLLGCREGPRTCQRISMDFDFGPGGGFHPTDSLPTLLLKFIWHLLGCKISWRTCQKISMDFVVGFACGFQRIPTGSNEIGFPFTLPSQIQTPSVVMQSTFEDPPKDFGGIRSRAWRRIPCGPDAFERSRFFPSTLPL